MRSVQEDWSDVVCLRFQQLIVGTVAKKFGESRFSKSKPPMVVDVLCKLIGIGSLVFVGYVFFGIYF